MPEIQPLVETLHVVQRTAPWVVPHPNRPMKGWERAVYRAFPPAQLAMRAAIYWARELFVLQFRRKRLGKLVERMALRHLEEQVPDAELRARLTPDYAIGCKRILPTDEWYPALVKPNVEVSRRSRRAARALDRARRRERARSRHDHLRHEAST